MQSFTLHQTKISLEKINLFIFSFYQVKIPTAFCCLLTTCSFWCTNTNRRMSANDLTKRMIIKTTMLFLGWFKNSNFPYCCINRKYRPNIEQLLGDKPTIFWSFQEHADERNNDSARNIDCFNNCTKAWRKSRTRFFCFYENVVVGMKEGVAMGTGYFI